MGLELVSAGKNLPDDINVVIEIPAHSAPIKYEVDKESGALMVDRFVGTCMFYPLDYGYVPQTLSLDGDPVDVLVKTPYPLQAGVVIRCRPIGLLRMEDESGLDAKILAVPVDKLTPLFKNVTKPADLGQELLDSVEHFFTHYKDLEKGKWVKLSGWEDVTAAREEIQNSAKRFHAEK
jgi:inorganic pyrophosphatase